MVMTLILTALAARAADMDCKTFMTARCLVPCPASLVVKCGSGYDGYVDDHEKANALTVAVFDKSTGRRDEVTLTQPPNPLRSYYGKLDGDAWVTRQLGDKGVRITSNTQLDLVGAKFPDAVKLYKDPDKREVATKSAQVKTAYACFYTQKPTLVGGGSCGSVCTGMVKCFQGDKPIGETLAGCKAVGAGCPSASACADDQDVHAKYPREVEASLSDDSARARSAR